MAVDIRVAGKFSGRIDRAALRRAALKALRAEGALPRTGLTIVIVGDAAIRDLNRRFHQVDASTDVLSFSGDEPSYLGDVVISYETARDNAHAAHWRIRDELELLVVHGVLHLLGYEDTSPRRRTQMWRRQAEILGRELKPLE